MKKIFLLSIMLSIVASCNIEKPIDTEEIKEPLDFSLVNTININSTLDQGRIMVFDSYPLFDGKFVIEPMLSAISPFSYDIKTPKAVESLYVYMDGALYEYPNADITISDKGARTKAVEIELIAKEYYPEDFEVPSISYYERSYLWVFEDNFPYLGDWDFNDIVILVTERTESLYTNVKEYRAMRYRFQILALGGSYPNVLTTYRSAHFESSIEFKIEGLTGFKNVFSKQNTWEEFPPIIHDVGLERTASYFDYIQLFNGTDYYINHEYLYNYMYPYWFEIPLTSDFTRFYWPLEGIRIDQAYPRYKDWVNSRCSTNGDWYKDTPVNGTTWNVELPDGLTEVEPIFSLY